MPNQDHQHGAGHSPLRQNRHGGQRAVLIRRRLGWFQQQAFTQFSEHAGRRSSAIKRPLGPIKRKPSAATKPVLAATSNSVIPIFRSHYGAAHPTIPSTAAEGGNFQLDHNHLRLDRTLHRWRHAAQTHRKNSFEQWIVLSAEFWLAIWHRSVFRNI